MKFCSICGSTVSWIIPSDDNRQRHVCDDASCNTIHYENPRVITGSLPTYEDKVLLCKRAIEPRYGYWTLPAGFLENGETVEEGARRETWEEAKASIQEASLYTLFDLPYINQVYFFYKAELADLNFSSGIESLEVKLFSEQDIPWDDLAFPVVNETLKHYFEDRKNQSYPFRPLTIRHNRMNNTKAND